MSLMDGIGLAETALFFLVGVLKFMWTYNEKRFNKLEEHMEKMDDKYRSITRELYQKT